MQATDMKKTPYRPSAIAGTCPDCCGDVAPARREGQMVLACLHCGTIVRSA